MRLTKATVTKIAVPDGRSEILVFDESLPGFGLRVRSGGKKTWIAQYRIGTKQRRLTLGSLDKLDPDEARQRARAALAKSQLGQDPQLEKYESRAEASVTFDIVRKKYLATAIKRLRPRSYELSELTLNRHWAPLSELPISSIRRATVANRMPEIAEQHGLVAANRARASLSAFFSWAIGEGIADTNPVVGTNKAITEIPRDRVLTDQELALVWTCLVDGDYCWIIRLLILTAQRRDEVGSMPWSEIDVGAATWKIESARTKNRLAHEVPLSRSAVEILANLPRREGRDLVFGSGAGPFQGWGNAKEALDERIKAANGGKAIAPWRMHDIRRTVATRLGDLGVLPHVVEAILNHISGSKAGVAGIYNRALYAPEKRAALDRWSDHLEGLIAKAAV